MKTIILPDLFKGSWLNSWLHNTFIKTRSGRMAARITDNDDVTEVEPEALAIPALRAAFQRLLLK
jgi:hypothetical protein